MTLLASSRKCRYQVLLQKLLVLVGIQCAVYLRQNANVGARKCSPEHISAATEAPGLSLGDLLTQFMAKVSIEVRTIQVKLPLTVQRTKQIDLLLQDVSCSAASLLFVVWL